MEGLIERKRRRNIAAMDRWSVPSLAASLVLGACDTAAPWQRALPSETLVDRIEQQLAGRECIGDLNHWQRTYFFARDHDSWFGAADTDELFIRFKQAGTYEFKAGRRIVSFEEGSGVIDHRQFRSVSGSYHVPSGEMSIWHCGWNCDASIPIGGHCG